ncbi:MAG: hypothetical protein AABM29_08680 [Actinomycetota bacterium]
MEASGEQQAGGEGAADEEQIREQIEQELKKVRVEDLMLQTISGLLNLTVRRIAKEDERDLAQAQVGIEAVRAWVDLLPEEAATQVRQALSELQMLYAQQVEGGAQPAASDRTTEDAGEQAPPQQQAPPPKPGPGREPPPRLWTPGSD